MPEEKPPESNEQLTKCDAYWSPLFAESQKKYDACLADTVTSDQSSARSEAGERPVLVQDPITKKLVTNGMVTDPQADKKIAAANAKCTEASRVFVDNPAFSGMKTYKEIQSRWYAERKKLGGTGKPGPPKYVSTKKREPEAPDPVPKLVSFGKIFTTFCMPALTRVAKQEGIDEVQVNFYQLNAYCGPVSLHSIAEFPIVISEAEEAFAQFCMARGGESMSVFDFIEWSSGKLFGSERAPGYALRHIYTPQTEPKPEAAKKDEKADEAAAAAQKSQQDKWYEKYGQFKKPFIAVKIDAVYEGFNNASIDLLWKLTHRVGPHFNPPPRKFDKNPNTPTKRILRVDIYDKNHNPYEGMSRRVFRESDGSYRPFQSKVSATEAKEFLGAYERSYAALQGATIGTTIEGSSQRITIDGVSVGPKIPKGKNILKELVGSTMPVITVGGTNATLIKQAQFSSKTDGKVAAMLLTGGTFKSKASLAPNGLSMSENNIPVRALPAELSISTMGCPIAEPRQMFFIDFETGTQLDNIYAVRELQHTFGPGRFETSWKFLYQDGYATFVGAPGVNREFMEMKNKQDQDKAAKEAAGVDEPGPTDANTAKVRR